MARFIINGMTPLAGEVTVSGSKNSGEAILVAAALAGGACVIDNMPKETSIQAVCMVLRSLGATVEVDGDRVLVDGSGISSHQAPYEWVRKERGSFYVAGLLLAKLGIAEVPLPGGCDIGSRPVNFHLDGFRQLGADVHVENGLVKAEASRLLGNHIVVGRSSVGATVNLILAASLAEGTTLLENAAREPEVVDLAVFLNKMGAHIRGAGTDLIRIDGVSELQPANHTVIQDRIEAGTFMMCAAMAGGDVKVKDAIPEHLRMPIAKLKEAGVSVLEEEDGLRVVRGGERLRPCDVITARYPGFATDLQSPFSVLMTTADGASIIRETVFEKRWHWVNELDRCGADIHVDNDIAIIRGVPQLTGAPVTVNDLRGGAALVIAGLGAKGTTIVENAEILDRGYEHLAEKLACLGADIKREDG